LAGVTPGPGGFASSGPFARPPGIHLAPAKVTPRPGVYSGPASSIAARPGLWVVALVVAVIVLGVILVARRRRR
jgi:hypothetical protein